MKNMKKGFTIIEMVIVIAIIGVLAAVLIPTYGNVVSKANESAALQTARSTMTNWLASSTSSAGVPTSGTDAQKNPFYAAYFEYESEDSGTVYQFRYTSGGVERTDESLDKYVNFSMKDMKLNTTATKALPQYVAEAYLTTPALDPNFDVEAFKVTIYKQVVGVDPAISTNYYIKYPAKGAYSCGGADTYAAVSETQMVYFRDTENNYTPSAINAVTTWQNTPNNATPNTPPANEFKISFDINGVTDATKPADMTTSGGKITSLPKAFEDDAVMSGYSWHRDPAGGTAVDNGTVYTADTTLYLVKNAE